MTETKWDVSSAPGVNKYLWHLLQTELGWSIDNYNGLVPITDPQQQPEMLEFDAPFIVYNWSLQATGTLYVEQEEQIAYAIFSREEKDIRQAVNLINNYFNRFDDSAKDVNAYVAANGSDLNKKFDYKYLRVLSSSGAQPSAQEGGRMDGMIIIRSCFIVDSVNGIRI